MPLSARMGSLALTDRLPSLNEDIRSVLTLVANENTQPEKIIIIIIGYTGKGGAKRTTTM